MPKIDRNLVKNIFKIEMMFEQMGDGGEKEIDWYYGVVVDIVNSKKIVVKIKWGNACLHEGDVKLTKKKLNVSMWNMKKRRREHGDMASVLFEKNDLMINT